MYPGGWRPEIDPPAKNQEEKGKKKKEKQKKKEMPWEGGVSSPSRRSHVSFVMFRGVGHPLLPNALLSNLGPYSPGNLENIGDSLSLI